MNTWPNLAAIDGPRVAGAVGIILALWSVSGWARLRGSLPSGDARKVNHVAAFVGLAFCFGWLEPAAARASALACGAILVCLAVVSCLCADRWPWRVFVAANTREEDRPHERFFFWSSWAISMAALLAVDGWANDVRVVRLLAVVVGIGDGVAEPVGKRWGRRRYRVPGWPGRPPATKTLEGSLAVLLGAVLGVFLCEAGTSTALGSLAVAALVVGLAAAVVEAASPHGLDNATLPLALAALIAPLHPMIWPNPGA